LGENGILMIFKVYSSPHILLGEINKEKQNGYKDEFEDPDMDVRTT
jgi:hypothetical protein